MGEGRGMSTCIFQAFERLFIFSIIKLSLTALSGEIPISQTRKWSPLDDKKIVQNMKSL